MNDLVSVIIPSYDRFSYLLQAVDSVVNQTYDAIEIIIVDDGSQDPRYKTHNFPKNCKVIHIDREKIEGGPGSVRNHGTEISTGKWIAFLDDDDIWLPKKLEIQIETMQHNEFQFSSTEGYFGEGRYNINNSYQLYNDEKFYKKINKKFKGTKDYKKLYPRVWDLDFLKIHNCIITSSVIVERELFNSFGGFRNIPGAEDYDCWLGLLTRTNLIYINKPLFYYDGKHGDGRNY
jgi:glycosyltransferase involved in cell wall biosynthesis